MEEKDKKTSTKKNTSKKNTSKKAQATNKKQTKTTKKVTTTNNSKAKTSAPKKSSPKKNTTKKDIKAKNSPKQEKIEEVRIEETQKPELTEEEIKIILASDKEEQNKVTDNTESIYLTKSFKTLSKETRVGHAFKKILLYAIILIGLFALGYYIIYPYIIKKLVINPNDKINEIISKIANDTEELIDAYIPNDSFVINSIIDVESDDEEYSSLNNYRYYLTNEVDTKNKIYNNTLQMKNNNTEIAYTFIKENNQTYINFDNEKEIYETNLEESSNLSNQDNITQNSNISKDNIKAFMNDNITFIKDIIENEKIQKSKDTISINNKDINITKYQISINESKQKEYIKKYKNDLLSKNDNVEVIKFLTNKDKDEIIDYLLEKVNGELKINIYLDKEYNFKGIDIEQNGFRKIYYYQDQDEFSIHFKTINDNPIDIKGTNKDGIKAIINYQNKKEIEININKLTKDELDIYIKTNTKEISLTKKSENNYNLNIIYNNLHKTKINSTIKIENKQIESKLKNYQLIDNTYYYKEARREFMNKLSINNLDYIGDKIND